MKHLFSHRSLPLLVSVTLAAITLPTLLAESHCPAGIASVTPRFVQRALIVIPVRINRKGPFDFIVDTGNQITVMDPSLAVELDLKPQGKVGLVSVASYAQASLTALDTLEAATKIVEKPFVVVQDLGSIRAVDPRIRGILGENFLAHFDLLIDYAHKFLCLDETGAMQQSIRGERISFLAPKHPENEVPFMERLVISVHFSGVGTRQIRLQLDSGSDAPILYAGNVTNSALLKRATLQGVYVTKAQRVFAVVPPQDIRIGTRTLNHVYFFTPVSVEQKIPVMETDGLLPTVVFQRLFISSGGHYVIFEPK